MKRILQTLLVFVVVPCLQRALSSATGTIVRLSAGLDRVAYMAARGVDDADDDEFPNGSV